MPRPTSPLSTVFVMALVWMTMGLAGSAWNPAAAGQDNTTLDIDFESFELDNGLRVIVHEDRSTPIVAVHVWYHVGSKDERPGRTGFAHLFEHLMFNGSENLDQDWFVAMEDAGATGMNGTTNWDRTNYFQTVPTSALDRALWMESDRMGHLLGAVDQAKLDEQRGVVLNEKRQRENKPYGRAWNWISESAFPAGHPYSWPVIGSAADLDGATLEDVRGWFREYYGPSNAVLVLAGDIDVATARTKVEKYFGDIPAGPPLARHASWIAPASESRRRVAEDRVPQTRIYRVWNTAELGTQDADLLELAAQILGGDKNSRLYERLVHRDRIATSVSAYYFGRELAGWFMVQADVRPGGDPAQVEEAIAEEVARFRDKGPSKNELARARIQLRAEFLRGLEALGGFRGVAGILAAGEVYEGNPRAYARWLREVDRATPKAIRQASERWLSKGEFSLVIRPFKEHAHAATGTDRTALPSLGTDPDLAFPTLQRASLENGLEIILAERRSLPLVEMELIFDAGYASDRSAGGRPGRASFGLNMLREGTSDLDSLEFSAAQSQLGAEISTRSTLDTSSVTLSALRENLADSLELFAEVVREPGFRATDIDRERDRWIARIQQEKASPQSMALRTLPPLLFGDHHAYGIPLTGSGTEASIQVLEASDLQAFHRDWLRPDGATLIVVGDVDMKTLLPLVQKEFGGWEAENPAKGPTKKLPRVARPESAHVSLIDRPGAEQSVIIAGQWIEPVDAKTVDTVEIMNMPLGGTFTSRLNMNLREEKHWSYGARTKAIKARGQRPFFAYAAVQTDKTAESMQEILRELQDYRGKRPATTKEVERAVGGRVRKLPGRFEKNKAVRAEIADAVRFGWPADRVTQSRSRLEALSPEIIQQSAAETLSPDRLTWVIVGDLSKIEAPVRALGLGETVVRDADGEILR